MQQLPTALRGPLVNLWLPSVVMGLCFSWPLIFSFSYEADVAMCLWYEKMAVGRRFFLHCMTLVIVYALLWYDAFLTAEVTGEDRRINIS